MLKVETLEQPQTRPPHILDLPIKPHKPNHHAQHTYPTPPTANILRARRRATPRDRIRFQSSDSQAQSISNEHPPSQNQPHQPRLTTRSPSSSKPSSPSTNPPHALLPTGAQPPHQARALPPPTHQSLPSRPPHHAHHLLGPTNPPLHPDWVPSSPAAAPTGRIDGDTSALSVGKGLR